MIKVFLTGANSPNAYQSDPTISFGGYMSSVELPNGEVDTLFGGISQFSATNKKSDYTLIAVKNTGKLKTQFNIKVVNPIGSYSTVELAVVEPTDCSDGILFEKITNRNSTPYYADFSSQSPNIPQLKPNQVYGVWLKRTVITPIPVLSNDDLVTAFDAGIPLPDNDDVIIEFSYDEA